MSGLREMTCSKMRILFKLFCFQLTAPKHAVPLNYNPWMRASKPLQTMSHMMIPYYNLLCVFQRSFGQQPSDTSGSSRTHQRIYVVNFGVFVKIALRMYFISVDVVWATIQRIFVYLVVWNGLIYDWEQLRRMHDISIGIWLWAISMVIIMQKFVVLLVNLIWT